jgi:hypothetical protein
MPTNDELMREAVELYLPALRSLNAFAEEVFTRIETCLETYRGRFAEYGLLTSCKRKVYPTLESVDQYHLSFELSNSSQDGAMVSLRPDEQASKSLYVGLWFYCPDTTLRSTLHKSFQTLERKDGSMCEFEYGRCYVGFYSDYRKEFPGFEGVLTRAAERYLSDLRSVDFRPSYSQRTSSIRG